MISISELRTKAISRLKPEAQYVITNDDYDTVIWHELDGVAPSKEELEEVMEQIKAEETKAQADKSSAKAALLDRLGISQDEAKLLLS